MKNSCYFAIYSPRTLWTFTTVRSFSINNHDGPYIFSVRNYCCGKVMISTNVCQEFCTRGVCPIACRDTHTPLGRHPAGRHPHGQTPSRQSPPVDSPGQTPPGQRPLPLGRHTHPEMATAADGTHPTGMHSCSV